MTHVMQDLGTATTIIYDVINEMVNIDDLLGITNLVKKARLDIIHELQELDHDYDCDHESLLLMKEVFTWLYMYSVEPRGEQKDQYMAMKNTIMALEKVLSCMDVTSHISITCNGDEMEVTQAMIGLRDALVNNIIKPTEETKGYYGIFDGMLYRLMELIIQSSHEDLKYVKGRITEKLLDF